MSRNFPIWNKVQNCTYQSDKSYGNKSTGEVEILVGSSKRNSHSFVNHVITKRETDYKGERVVVFKFSVDDVILKAAIFKLGKNGTAGDHIKTFTKLKSIKSLKL